MLLQSVKYSDVFRACTCAPSAVAKYQKKISGPLLDRIDLHIEVPRLSEEELLQVSVGESSSAIRERVCRARDIQARRFACPPPAQVNAKSPAEPPHTVDQLVEQEEKPRSPHTPPLFCNAQMSSRELRAYCAPSESVQALLRAAIGQLGLSARAYDRLLKVSRTIADLDGVEDIQTAHLAEAIQYRSLDRKLWGA